jgi:hypothetical protein
LDVKFMDEVECEEYANGDLWLLEVLPYMWGLVEYENDELITCVRVLHIKLFHVARLWGP